MIRWLQEWRRAAEETMRQSRQITALAREIRATDPYYADKTDLRIQLDAMKRWRSVIAEQAGIIRQQALRELGHEVGDA